VVEVTKKKVKDIRYWIPPFLAERIPSLSRKIDEKGLERIIEESLALDKEKCRKFLTTLISSSPGIHEAAKDPEIRKLLHKHRIYPDEVPDVKQITSKYGLRPGEKVPPEIYPKVREELLDAGFYLSYRIPLDALKVAGMKMISLGQPEAILLGGVLIAASYIGEYVTQKYKGKLKEAYHKLLHDKNERPKQTMKELAKYGLRKTKDFLRDGLEEKVAS
jgi:hypothetical protein